MNANLPSKINKSVFACFVLAAFLAVIPMCVGQKIVLIARETEASQSQLQAAARFYGIQLQPLLVSSEREAAFALDQIKKRDVLGVVATASSLDSLSKTALSSALRRDQEQNAPLLVIDVKQETCGVLKEWSNGALRGCSDLADDTQGSFYQVGSDPEVTRQLSNEKLPAISRALCGFQMDPERKPVPLLSIAQRDASVPVFVRTSGSGGPIFFLAERTSATASDHPPSDVVSTFSSISPFLMFVRYAAGEFAWHSTQSLANFTIDDPWLTEPYGYLGYRALLREMEKHHFHTTIAFIPWNFDRSQPEVVALFHDHSDRFSISIHGNNHDHKEFDQYTAVPLADQVADIKQALARMEKFSTLTAISYDRVMVFPHSIAPQETLGQLKKYGFLATVNADDVPMGTQHPTDPNFDLRSYSADFADFPSLKRFSAEVPLPRVVVAINAFLENPLLFYGHAAMFQQGIEKFSPTADIVNSVAPQTEWRSLGYIADHLSIVRSRADGAMDVKMFGNNLVLENTSDKERLYVVRKADNAEPPIKSLIIGGEPQKFDRANGEITLRLSIPARASRRIQIQYVNDLNLAQSLTTDPSLRLTLLRRASDFRDIVLPKHRWGRWITSFYYRHQMDSLESDLESRWFGTALIAGLALLFVPIGRLLLKLRTSRSIANASGVSK